MCSTGEQIVQAYNELKLQIKHLYNLSSRTTENIERKITN